MAAVTQLGYMGLGVSNLDEWRTFATETLGLAINGDNGNDGFFLREDENHHRFAVTHSEKDDLTYLGWEVKDEAALREMADQLRSNGIEVRNGTPEEARERHVVGLIKFNDPSGVPMEVYYGPHIQWEKPFLPSRPISGFETGAQGLGHLVMIVDDYTDSVNFFRDALGMKVSDYITFELAPGFEVTAAFFHCNPRHHSIAIVEMKNAPKRLNHFMLQVKSLDDVGQNYYECLEKGIIATTLGRHTNDHMFSFYLRTPSGFEVEWGTGARTINDDVWEVQMHRAPSSWGHQRVGDPEMPEAVGALS